MVGAGVIILSVLWLTTLVIWIFAIRIGGSIIFAAVGTFALVLAITIILWLIPKGPIPQDEPGIKYDTSYVGRVLVLLFCWSMVALGLATVGLLHLFQHHQATPLKTF